MAVEISSWMPAPAHASRSAFAIGDVHGRADLLEEIHAEITRIARDDALERPMLVHLGDFIDRGPASLRVLDIVAAGIGGAFEQHDLMANHEQMMMLGLFGPEGETDRGLAVWLMNGGTSVLEEAGANNIRHLSFKEIRDIMLEALAGDRLALLNRLESHVRLGSYLFVHAGVPPLQPLEQTFGPGWDSLPSNSREEYYSPLWIREGFLYYDGALPENVIAIHGHTIRRQPEVRPNRICIDTGAYRGGKLTALELRGREMRFIQSL